MNPVLPNSFLKRMAPADRAKLGKAGQTAEEAEAAFVARTESELQLQIKAMLNRNGIHVIRSRMDKRTTTANGTPDLLFAFPLPGSGHAIPVAWEVKMPGKKPTDDQIETLLAMSKNGWQTAVVKSYDEALGLFNRLRGEIADGEPCSEEARR